ncbi:MULTISPECIES: hypothetical protein [Meridianimaribacter]|uniref:WD40 repeat domain-containing protein n=1 Tax=Meridianimaribacter flavus TaxID=571115 RepID=A0ABY2G713_9FLAO|nr:MULTISPECIES: hypothetical protein [Meridianimaribacter]TBV28270.1 hypothetical protein DMZ43_04315 [Meridianimaribacter sp. CL38]TDY13597.1 hypothetical protein A8975_0190 [Meridianimaribacter flavus]
MKKFKLIFLFGLIATIAFSQESETVIKTDFGIRDFIVQKDSIIYIKKRNAYLKDIKTKTTKDYFIGGYGLKFLQDNKPNTIITVSNELVNNVSSVRFYDKKKDRFESVFYNDEGKIIDAVILPELNLFILSLISEKIIIVNYSKKPKFLKIAEISLNTFSRKMVYEEGALLYCTDKGKVYKYNINNYQNELIYDGNELITDFFIDGETIFLSTNSGILKKVNIETNKEEQTKISDNFINTFINSKENLVCGSWNGDIYIINKKDLKLKQKLSIHKRSVLKIETQDDSIFYSSSLDKTIKKWYLNQN